MWWENAEQGRAAMHAPTPDDDRPSRSDLHDMGSAGYPTTDDGEDLLAALQRSVTRARKK